MPGITGCTVARRAFRHFTVGAEFGGFTVPGLYEALLERERRHCSRPDPRLMRLHHPDGQYCTTPDVICEHDPLPLPRTALLGELEAGRVVRLQGRNLRGHSLPPSRLRRDEAFDWFEVSPGDAVVRLPCTG
jgi:hypothetical protein